MWGVTDRPTPRARRHATTRRAIAEHALPADADADLLARYLLTVATGIAVQAAGGADADELRLAAEMALRAWPSL